MLYTLMYKSQHIQDNLLRNEVVRLGEVIFVTNFLQVQAMRVAKWAGAGSQNFHQTKYTTPVLCG